MNKATVQRFFEVVHVVALSAWFGAVGMSGIVAATVFPIMGRMKPTLGAYAEYGGDHALLAGGLIAGRVFLIVDTVQFIAGGVALASFVTMIMAGYSINTVGRLIRSVAFLMTMGLLSWYLFVLGPAMAADLSNYWDLAAAGNTEQAEVYKNAFFAFHQTAANGLKGLMAAVLLCLILAVWTGVGSTVGSTAGSTVGSTKEATP